MNVRHRERGQTLVEFAFVIVVIAAFMAGILRWYTGRVDELTAANTPPYDTFIDTGWLEDTVTDWGRDGVEITAIRAAAGNARLEVDCGGTITSRLLNVDYDSGRLTDNGEAVAYDQVAGKVCAR